MILPNRWFQPEELKSNQSVDYFSAEVSPVDAVATVMSVVDGSPEVYSLQLSQIGNTFAYEILLSDGSTHLIDAESGQEFYISPEVAESIVKSDQSVSGNIVSIERLDTHNYYYPFGELPVYRIIVDSDRSHTYYVSLSSGFVSQSTILTRLRSAITSLHTFEPLRLLSNRDTYRKSALLVVSLLAIGVPLTGYFLFFLPYFKKKFPARS